MSKSFVFINNAAQTFCKELKIGGFHLISISIFLNNFELDPEHTKTKQKYYQQFQKERNCCFIKEFHRKGKLIVVKLEFILHQKFKIFKKKFQMYLLKGNFRKTSEIIALGLK